MTKVFLAGDSTMSRKEEREYPEHGWGMMIPDFFTSSIVFINEAKNGRSTKSFIEEGRWGRIIRALESEDYVLIQFGHNDEKSEDPSRYTDPAGTYRQNLEYFIRTARGKGARPVLLTSLCRRKFNTRGELEMTHGLYPETVLDIALEQHVPCIDMEEKSATLLKNMGPEESKKLFMHLAPGEFPNHPEGKEDDTHFNAQGAREMAALAAEGIREMVPELAKYRK